VGGGGGGGKAHPFLKPVKGGGERFCLFVWGGGGGGCEWAMGEKLVSKAVDEKGDGMNV